MRDIDHHVPVNCSGRPRLEAAAEEPEEPPPDAPDTEPPADDDQPSAKEDPKPKPKKDTEPKTPRARAASGLRGDKKRKADADADEGTDDSPHVHRFPPPSYALFLFSRVPWKLYVETKSAFESVVRI